MASSTSSVSCSSDSNDQQHVAVQQRIGTDANPEERMSSSASSVSCGSDSDDQHVAVKQRVGTSILSAQDVQCELEIFKRQRPDHVLSVSPVQCARATVLEGKVVRIHPTADGPWTVTLVVQGPAPYYDQPITARLLFTAGDEVCPRVAFHTSKLVVVGATLL